MARARQPVAAPAPRVFGYCRVSTVEQSSEGVSLDEQQRRITGRALEIGVELTRIFVEEGVSGSTPLYRRPQGEKLLAAVRPGDTVIAAKLDRVFRSALDALQVIEDFRRRSIRLILLDIGDVSGNGVSQLVITIMSAVAEFERKRISERVKDSKAQLRHEGRHQGGSRPFGWQFGPKMNGHDKARELIPDAAEQAAIAEILKLRKRGQTLMAIRDAMRARGFVISHQLVAGPRAAACGGGGGGMKAARSADDVRASLARRHWHPKIIDNALRGAVAEDIVADILAPDWQLCVAGWNAWDMQHRGDARADQAIRRSPLQRASRGRNIDFEGPAL